MIKCDFCKRYNPLTHKCEKMAGLWYDTSCDDAAKRFLSFLRSKNSRSHTKNININKKFSHKKYNGKKK